MTNSLWVKWWNLYSPFFFFICTLFQKLFSLRYVQTDKHYNGYTKVRRTTTNLTLSQKTNFGLFQTERVCRLQFQIWWKWHEVSQKGRKHCGNMRNCSLWEISPFPIVFSKDLYCRHKNKGFFGKRLRLASIFNINQYCSIKENHLVKKKSDWTIFEINGNQIINLSFFSFRTGSIQEATKGKLSPDKSCAQQQINFCFFFLCRWKKWWPFHYVMKIAKKLTSHNFLAILYYMGLFCHINKKLAIWKILPISKYKLKADELQNICW